MTHGQIAYEAYCKHTGNKSLISGAELPPWDALDTKIQEAWLAAAKAVTGCVNVPLTDAARKAFEEHVESGRRTQSSQSFESIALCPECRVAMTTRYTTEDGRMFCSYSCAKSYDEKHLPKDASE